MSKLTVDQLRRIFTKTFKHKGFKACNSEEDVLEVLFQDVSGFRAPCYISDTFIYSERIPVFASKTLELSSDLCMSLLDRRGETALVADSVLVSLAGLYFVKIANNRAEFEDWLNLSAVGKMNIYIRNVSEDDFLVVSKLSAFISENAE